MNELMLSQFVRYLTISDDFVTIANNIFKDNIDAIGAGKLCLLQIGPDGERANVIAGIGVETNASFCVADLPESVFVDGYTITFPIFIRDALAMYVCANSRDSEFSKEQTELMTQMTLVLQGIASKTNFEDSLANSYRIMGDILNDIPTGIAVLDNVNKSILLVNDVAGRSEAIQSVIGQALSIYLETGNKLIEEVYDKESGLWFDVSFGVIKWIDGNNVLLCTTIDVTQKMKNQQKIEYQANNDYLTGLFNRMKCERDLKEIIDNAVKTGEKGILLFLDLDDFKQVNDGLGHQHGDVLLQQIANGLMSIPQIENSCYRMGGDEFVVVIKNNVFDDATEIVEKICDMFATAWDLLGVEYYSTMSMGLAIFPDDGVHVHDVIKKADFAMYEAKKGGKNRYLWYSEVAGADTEDNKDQIGEVIKAAVNDGFKGFDCRFYPIFDKDNQLKAVGTKLYFTHEDYGVIPDDEFMAIVEYVGLLAPIGQYMLEMAAKSIVEINRKYHRDLKIMVNVSEVQILSPSAVGNFMSAWKDNNARTSDIVLCLSERLSFRDENKAKGVVEILKAYGFLVAITEFGVGSMSLSAIDRFNADIVKIESYYSEYERLANAIRAISADSGRIIALGNATDKNTAEAIDWYDGKEYGEPVGLEEFVNIYLNK